MYRTPTLYPYADMLFMCELPGEVKRVIVLVSKTPREAGGTNHGALPGVRSCFAFANFPVSRHRIVGAANLRESNSESQSVVLLSDSMASEVSPKNLFAIVTLLNDLRGSLQSREKCTFFPQLSQVMFNSVEIVIGFLAYLL
jgi:hypothetical protein